MDSMEVNKGIAAVLVAGIAFMVCGLVANGLVWPETPEKPAIKVEAAAPSGGAAPKPVELAPIAPLLAKADPAAGEADTKKFCVACHTFTEGGANGIGPNLYNVVGSPVIHEQNYNYSAALKAKTGNWTYEDLNHWLYKPSLYAPGTRMTFAGLNSEKDRANVIAYLRSLSKNPQPLPNP